MITLLGKFWMKPWGWISTFAFTWLMFFGLLFTGYWKYAHLVEQETMAFLVVEKAIRTLPRRQENREFVLKYRAAKADFVEERLSSLPLLSEEASWTQRASSHSIFCQEPHVEQAKQLLKNNTLSYQRKAVPSLSSVKETLFVQKNLVHVNFSDLAQILATVESLGHGEEKPQLLFTKLRLTFEEKGLFPYFTLDTELLQRELSPAR